jgi:hypothetical protein
MQADAATTGHPTIAAILEKLMQRNGLQHTVLKTHQCEAERLDVVAAASSAASFLRTAGELRMASNGETHSIAPMPVSHYQEDSIKKIRTTVCAQRRRKLAFALQAGIVRLCYARSIKSWPKHRMTKMF